MSESPADERHIEKPPSTMAAYNYCSFGSYWQIDVVELRKIDQREKQVNSPAQEEPACC